MRIVRVSNLNGGEILGKQIFDSSGRVLINSGVKITHFHINKLKSLDVFSLYIDDEISKDIEIEESISDKTRQSTKNAIKEMMKKYSKEGKTDSGGIIKSVNSILDDLQSNKDILINIAEIQSSDDSLYSHSINVCVLSTILGINMGYNMSKLRDISLGALLHDIGKSKILNDKKLQSEFKSEDELNKYIELMHPKVGYDFLKEQYFANAYSRVAVLMHHEKVDGTGYPLKLKGEGISDIAKIVSICNTFNNMVTGNGNEKSKPVVDIIEYLFGMSNTHFDPEIVKKLTTNIAVYPTGSGVILNSREKCLVIRQNKSVPLRPVVKVIYDKDGLKLHTPFEIDLLKELTVFIQSSCEL